MKKILLLLLISPFLLNAQIPAPTYMPAPEGYGVNYNLYDDEAILPSFVHEGYLYGYTKKRVGNVRTNYLVKINLANDEMYFFDTVQLPGNAYYVSPEQFQEKDGFIYFLLSNTVYRINHATNELTTAINNVDRYFIFGDTIIYEGTEYSNPPSTHIYSISTNTSVLLSGPQNTKLYNLGAFYYDNDILYFRANVSTRTRPSNAIFSYNANNGTLNTIEQYAFTTSSHWDQGVSSVTRVNNNLLYLMRSSNSTFKYTSVNLETGTRNTSFSFIASTNIEAEYVVDLPFLVGDTAFLINNAGEVYSTDGVTAPVLTDLPLLNASPLVRNDMEFLNYNNENYFINYTEANGFELWKTNGTAQGTAIVKDIIPGAQSTFNGEGGAIEHNYRIFFYTHAGAIYTSDGTADGTVAITENAAFSRVHSIKPYGNALYFYGESAATGNGLYKLDISEFSLSANPVANKPELVFYPNPAVSKIYFKEEVQSISITALNGQQLTFYNNTKEADITMLAAGIYIVRTTQNNGTVQHHKMIKK